MDVSGFYNFDPFAYPLLEPATPGGRSLGVQPPGIFIPQGYPWRWSVVIRSADGDYTDFVGINQVLWDGQYDFLQPVQCNNRDPSFSEPGMRWSCNVDEQYRLDFTLELRIYPDPNKFVVFNMLENFNQYYRPITILEPEVIGPAWFGTLNSPVRIIPIPFWRDLS